MKWCVPARPGAEGPDHRPYAHLREFLASNQHPVTPPETYASFSGGVAAAGRDLRKEETGTSTCAAGRTSPGQPIDDGGELVIRSRPLVLGSGMPMFAPRVGFLPKSVRTHGHSQAVRPERPTRVDRPGGGAARAALSELPIPAYSDCMGSKGREVPRTSHDPQRRQTCAACGQPVESVVKRHKTLGTYVPLWKPGPCRNPDCPLYVPREGGTKPDPLGGPDRSEGSGRPDEPGGPGASDASAAGPSGESPNDAPGRWTGTS